MNIIELKKVANFQQSKRLSKRYDTFEKLILELNQKEITPEIINAINQEIESINSYTEPSKSLSKQVEHINLSGLFDGIYIIRVSSAGQTFTTKLLKQ